MLSEPEFLDFVHIGARRAGNGWLARALAEHPQLHLPAGNRPSLFADRRAEATRRHQGCGLEAYRKVFLDAVPGTLLGDVVPCGYLDTNAAPKLAASFPRLKISVILRNPADMLHSLHASSNERGSDLADWLTQDTARLDAGFYHRLLTPWFDWFPAEQISVRIFESFFQDPISELCDLLHFLDADPDFRPSVPASIADDDDSAIEGSAVSFVRRMMHQARRPAASATRGGWPKGLPRMEADMRAAVLERYEHDIARLETLIGQDLDFWFDERPMDTARLPDNVIPLHRAMQRQGAAGAEN